MSENMQVECHVSEQILYRHLTQSNTNEGDIDHFLVKETNII